jgi:hypothetical protein
MYKVQRNVTKNTVIKAQRESRDKFLSETEKKAQKIH